MSGAITPSTHKVSFNSIILFIETIKILKLIKFGNKLYRAFNAINTSSCSSLFWLEHVPQSCLRCAPFLDFNKFMQQFNVASH